MMKMKDSAKSLCWKLCIGKAIYVYSSSKEQIIKWWTNTSFHFEILTKKKTETVAYEILWHTADNLAKTLEGNKVSPSWKQMINFCSLKDMHNMRVFPTSVTIWLEILKDL